MYMHMCMCMFKQYIYIHTYILIATDFLQLGQKSTLASSLLDADSFQQAVHLGDWCAWRPIKTTTGGCGLNSCNLTYPIV